MKVKVAGHTYELSEGQTIQFIHKEPIEEGSTELKTVADGTTSEELIEVLIDRLVFLQAKLPCRENAIAITKLEECLMWLNKRTADRKNRNVEGKNEK
jgi:predicted subunit of tRNA(5-methylaminomethyl-2-thiouridylate) methyltransferase